MSTQSNHWGAEPSKYPQRCYEAHDGIKVISTKVIYGVCVQMILPSRSEWPAIRVRILFILKKRISVFENDHFTLSTTDTHISRCLKCVMEWLAYLTKAIETP